MRGLGSSTHSCLPCRLLILAHKTLRGRTSTPFCKGELRFHIAKIRSRAPTAHGLRVTLSRGPPAHIELRRSVPHTEKAETFEMGLRSAKGRIRFDAAAVYTKCRFHLHDRGRVPQRKVSFYGFELQREQWRGRDLLGRLGRTRARRGVGAVNAHEPWRHRPTASPRRWVPASTLSRLNWPPESVCCRCSTGTGSAPTRRLPGPYAATTRTSPIPQAGLARQASCPR